MCTHSRYIHASSAPGPPCLFEYRYPHMQRSRSRHILFIGHCSASPLAAHAMSNVFIRDRCAPAVPPDPQSLRAAPRRARAHSPIDASHTIDKPVCVRHTGRRHGRRARQYARTLGAEWPEHGAIAAKVSFYLNLFIIPIIFY